MAQNTQEFVSSECKRSWFSAAYIAVMCASVASGTAVIIYATSGDSHKAAYGVIGAVVAAGLYLIVRALDKRS